MSNQTEQKQVYVLLENQLLQEADTYFDIYTKTWCPTKYINIPVTSQLPICRRLVTDTTGYNYILLQPDDVTKQEDETLDVGYKNKWLPTITSNYKVKEYAKPLLFRRKITQTKLTYFFLGPNDVIREGDEYYNLETKWWEKVGSAWFGKDKLYFNSVYKDVMIRRFCQEVKVD
jgi:hypothetical protein